MGRQRTEAEQQIADLLRTARRSLKMSVAFLSRLDGTTQHLEVMESALPLVFRDGLTQPQETTFCQAILDGRLPPVIPDVREHPEAMVLPAARIPRIRSYVSAPVRFADGELYGTFCAFGFTSDPELTTRDQALIEVLASAASVILEPEVHEQHRRAEIAERLAPVVEAGGPLVVLQPVVDLATGDRVGAEALSRFPAYWGKAPDTVFAEAHRIGAGDRLELLALRRAAARARADVVVGWMYHGNLAASLGAALAARGNVAEALHVYERARTVLRDELGIAPGPAIHALDATLLGRRYASR